MSGQSNRAATGQNGGVGGGGPNKTCQFKLVLLGESSVGKSSLVLRFVKGQFHEFQESTIGAAFLTQTVQIDDTTVKFEIWDTAGQERYHSLAPMYYRGAQAAIVVYDLSNKETFQKAQTWVKELQRQASPSIVIALAGNKLDLAQKRQVRLFSPCFCLLFSSSSATIYLYTLIVLTFDHLLCNTVIIYFKGFDYPNYNYSAIKTFNF